MKNDVNQLIEIDQMFCKEAQIDGYQAWDKYLSDEVIIAGSDVDLYDTDRTIIIESLKKLYELKNIHFTWEPKHAFISLDQTLGVTTGTYYRTFELDGKKIEKSGKYTTTWKKINTHWRIVYDMGN